jgi:NTE family protein
MSVLYIGYSYVKPEVSPLPKHNQEQINQLKKYLGSATSYEQWKDIAQSLDHLEQREAWKDDIQSDIYNYDVLLDRFKSLQADRLAGNTEDLARALREGLHHDLGNMGNIRLYQESYFGTKKLIEQYVEEVCLCIEYLCDNLVVSMTSSQKLDFFKTVLLSFGRPALLMSGGASLGAFHLGVAKSLWENDLLPQVITGSSAGSIIAAVLGTRTDEEIPELFDPEAHSLHPWRWKGLFSGLSGRGFMDQQQLQRVIREYLGEYTMEEAYERSGRSINVTVSPVQHHQKERLLSGITTPYLLLWSAVLASCAVPAIFPPVKLQKKDKHGDTAPYMPRLRWVDGSVVSDLPVERLMHLYDVNYSIVSQTNPHVVPFLKDKAGSQKTSFAEIPMAWLKAELKFRSKGLSDYVRKNANSQILRQSAGQLHAMMSQTYYGDVTIAPNYKLRHYMKVLSNPSSEFIQELMLEGERSTWPKMSMIATHSRISKTLEKSIAKLKNDVRSHRAKLSIIA